MQDVKRQRPIPGFATPEDTKEFSAFYPASVPHPVAETHFRYDPSLGDMEAPGAPRCCDCPSPDAFRRKRYLQAQGDSWELLQSPTQYIQISDASQPQKRLAFTVGVARARAGWS